ncbi:sulfatase family protein [Azohydromonas caseinilytica]|uniref:Sulfatase n=1 Tax=Azohydromonas caseinilytica TaxID=2728836 RepID=A0A848F7K2_9BURK|nr:sulfatase [Azohydromonas caseinilytica]NML15554.1 sulfatase [Azohydromonas caseinilytica]
MKRFSRSWRLLAPLAVLGALAAPAAAQRPNILYILVDDMEHELFQYMPKTKRLITDQGALFDQNFTSLSLCCPSRTTTLRGQYSHNTGIFTNAWPNGGFAKFHTDGLESSTIATWLQGAGYRTGLIGKYLNGYPNSETGPLYIPPGWSYWFVPNGGTPYAQYNYSINFNGRTVSYGNTQPNHFNDVVTAQANTFLRESAADPARKPFFLFFNPTLPHAPATPPKRYMSQLLDVKMPRKPSFNEADVSDKPRWLQKVPLLTADEISRMETLYRKRRQSMLALDDTVESLLATLQATGQLANTYVFFSSDNGWHQGEHRLPAGKSRLYEEDIRVPLAVRGPGIPAGRVVKKLTANVDLAPTFAQIGGAAAPAFVDGRSLVPLFSGTPPARWRQSLLLESHTGFAGEAAESQVGGSLRTDPGLLEPADMREGSAALAPAPAHVYRGLRTAFHSTFALYDVGDGEYYDMYLDPYQMQNRYTTMNATLKAALTAQLNAMRNASGQALRDAEEVPAGKRPGKN